MKLYVVQNECQAINLIESTIISPVADQTLTEHYWWCAWGQLIGYRKNRKHTKPGALSNYSILYFTNTDLTLNLSLSNPI